MFQNHQHKYQEKSSSTALGVVVKEQKCIHLVGDAFWPLDGIVIGYQTDTEFLEHSSQIDLVVEDP